MGVVGHAFQVGGIAIYQLQDMVVDPQHQGQGESFAQFISAQVGGFNGVFQPLHIF